ncbi:MAG TPA: SDR family oxidoreductase [Bacteroidia bacterium]|nr:SDR family oxidoreductase [Sphingobacteriales bacterium]HPD65844.1 SDR family oxidoreductase [Bacteroidia bacterium]HRS59721.1 SDR family oxidoreductase [Bacteroidia bacterium]HRU68161.1 SDR family oxidoreductase [Bacteroidia bacterium]
MSFNLLEGKKGIILGALNESSLAWHVAEKVANEGGKFVLSNSPLAIRFGNLKQLAEKLNAPVIPADVTLLEDLENLVEEAMRYAGGKLDFVLHSVGMSRNVVKKRPYVDLDYQDFLETIDISALSLHKLMQVLYKQDALNEYASVVTLSYIGAQRVFTTYSDMSQAKAMLESIVRSFGYHYGIAKKVRINAVSQSPTKTTAGKGIKGFDSFYHFADKMSPLGNASPEDCARYIVTLFSDYTKMVTMQTLFHDGGFSMTGISNEVLQHYKPDYSSSEE